MACSKLGTPQALEGAHFALLGVATFFYSGAYLPLGPSLAGIDFTIMSMLMLFGGVGMFVVHWRASLRLLPRVWPFGLLLVLAIASTNWSIAPDSSLRRSFALLALIILSVSSYAAFGPQRVMRVVVFSMLGISAGCVLLALVNPALGYDVEEYANAIRGFYYQKNGFGFALLHAVFALSYLVLERREIRRNDIIITACLVVLLVLSRSTTSLLLSALCIGLTTTMVWFDRGGIWRWGALFGLIAGVLIGLMLVLGLGTEGLFELIGKDSTLTGRIQIWEAVKIAIGHRDTLGYGYGPFWLVDSIERQGVWDAVGWKPPSAHSGYLDVRLQLGEVGLALVVFMLFASVWIAARGLFGAHRRRALWLLMLITIEAILDRTESGLFSPDLRMVFWLLGLMAVAAPLRVNLPVSRPAPTPTPHATRRVGAAPPWAAQSRNS